MAKNKSKAQASTGRQQAMRQDAPIPYDRDDDGNIVYPRTEDGNAGGAFTMDFRKLEGNMSAEDVSQAHNPDNELTADEVLTAAADAANDTFNRLEAGLPVDFPGDNHDLIDLKADLSKGGHLGLQTTINARRRETFAPSNLPPQVQQSRTEFGTTYTFLTPQEAQDAGMESSIDLGTDDGTSTDMEPITLKAWALVGHMEKLIAEHRRKILARRNVKPEQPADDLNNDGISDTGRALHNLSKATDENTDFDIKGSPFPKTHTHIADPMTAFNDAEDPEQDDEQKKEQEEDAALLLADVTDEDLKKEQARRTLRSPKADMNATAAPKPPGPEKLEPA